jgi:hypothetical protein
VGERATVVPSADIKLKMIFYSYLQNILASLRRTADVRPRDGVFGIEHPLAVCEPGPTGRLVRIEARW